MLWIWRQIGAKANLPRDFGPRNHDRNGHWVIAIDMERSLLYHVGLLYLCARVSPTSASRWVGCMLHFTNSVLIFTLIFDSIGRRSGLAFGGPSQRVNSQFQVLYSNSHLDNSLLPSSHTAQTALALSVSFDSHNPYND